MGMHTDGEHCAALLCSVPASLTGISGLHFQLSGNSKFARFDLQGCDYWVRSWWHFSFWLNFNFVPVSPQPVFDLVPP